MSNDVLSHIFSYLSPRDRLNCSVVCSRFYAVSRKDWLDVVDVDLAQVPEESIASVLRQTPNVETIRTNNTLLYLDRLLNHPLVNLTALKLYYVTVASGPVAVHEKYTLHYPDLLCSHSPGCCDCFQRFLPITEQQAVVRTGQKLTAFLDNFPQLQELVLYQPQFIDMHYALLGDWISFSPPVSLCSTLTRLVLHLAWAPVHGHWVGYGGRLDGRLFCASLASLRKLECLSFGGILLLEHSSYACLAALNQAFCEALTSLHELREFGVNGVLLMAPDLRYKKPLHLLAAAVLRLAKLEILLVDGVWLEADELEDLIEKQSSLRILLLADVINFLLTDFDDDITQDLEVEKIILPARKRFLNGRDGDPLPTLHIFVGQKMALKYLFTESASGASKVYPINKSMPVFLKEAEIGEIFAGSWLAEQICEGAKLNAGMLWYEDAVTQSASTIAADNEG